MKTQALHHESMQNHTGSFASIQDKWSSGLCGSFWAGNFTFVQIISVEPNTKKTNLKAHNRHSYSSMVKEISMQVMHHMTD